MAQIECSKCGTAKPADHFPRGRICKTCINEAQNLRYAKRRGRVEQHSLVRRNEVLFASGRRECRVCGEVKPLEAYRLKDGKRAHCCLACTNARQREAYAANANGMRDRLREHGKKRRDKHGERLNAEKRVYVAANRQKVTDRQNRWAKQKLKDDPMFAVKKRLRSLMSNAFRSVAAAKSADTEAVLGCTFEAFKAHIERQFQAGMCWANRGEWHLDHIVPLATAATEADVIRLNHFTNYRPLWAAENIAKGAKVLSLL